MNAASGVRGTYILLLILLFFSAHASAQLDIIVTPPGPIPPSGSGPVTICLNSGGPATFTPLAVCGTDAFTASSVTLNSPGDCVTLTFPTDFIGGSDPYEPDWCRIYINGTEYGPGWSVSGPSATCGNSICDAGEAITCPDDCATTPTGCVITINTLGDIFLGDDFSPFVTMSGCPGGGTVELIVTDPLGREHKATTVVAGSVRYLVNFDNSPNTDICGYYGMTVKFGGTTAANPSMVLARPPTASCDIVGSPGSIIAERTTSCASLQGISGNEAMVCCDLECCTRMTYGSDCGPTAATRTNLRADEIPQKGFLTLCTQPNAANPGNYDTWDVNSTKYTRINTQIMSTSTTYTLIDKDECIVADQDTCTNTVKTLVIDRARYIDFIHGVIRNLPPGPDMVRCMGFYWVWLYPGGPAGTPSWWPYEYELSKSRYTSPNPGAWVYNITYVDYFYCYVPILVPNPISRSRWCHDINLGWYSVITPYQGTGMAITPEQVIEVQRWDNLTGYLVTGHICPWCVNHDNRYTFVWP